VHQDFATTAKAVLEKESSIKHVLTINRSFKSAEVDSNKDAGTASNQDWEKGSLDTSKGKLSFIPFEKALADTTDDTIHYASFPDTQLAQLYYTSGTTGKAKGVMLNHMNVTSNALGAITELRFSDATTWGHFAPIFHLADAWAIFAVTWVGGKHVYNPYFKAADVLRSICPRANNGEPIIGHS
jgi:acyl-CoA synthetase (AMP-forming)/AMP-acid ligase II